MTTWASRLSRFRSAKTRHRTPRFVPRSALDKPVRVGRARAGYYRAVTAPTRDLVERLAQRFLELELRVAVAESLTSGRIASALGAGSDAAEWFAGGIVAYASDVKFELLDVEPGPVINAACARQLAKGAAKLLDA